MNPKQPQLNPLNLPDFGKRRPAATKPAAPEERDDLRTATEEADAEDSWEEPSGDGRVSRHPVLGVQLLDGSKLLAWIPYGVMIWGESPDVNRAVVFEAVRGETLYKVTITGEAPEFTRVADKLLEGRRLSCRVNGNSVTRIQVEAVPVAKK